jgi:hypothetical protein
MNTEQVLIKCSNHGDAYPTYMCAHLVADPVQEWFCDYPSEENPWPDSWCAKCNLEFEEDGEWNERTESAIPIKLVCHHCYDASLTLSAERLRGEALDEWNAFLIECCNFLRGRQDTLFSQFELGEYEHWNWDQDTGELVFSSNGIPKVVASIEFIGSISTVSDTWLWSWANFSLNENVRSLVKKVRDFGEKHGYPRLTTPKWSAQEVDGWEMTSLAAYVLDARGAYRTPSENGFTFLAIMDIRRV